MQLRILRSQLTVRHTPLLEAFGGQEQYYIRSASHVPFAHLLFSYWRGKSYIPMWEILVLSNLCTLMLLLLFICNCGCTVTDKQQQQNTKVTTTVIVQKDWAIYVHWYLCCCCYCVVLLLFNCNWGCTMTDEQQQQNYTVTMTTQRTKRSICIHILCNFQLRRQITVRHILLRCTSPGGGIWWPRGVLHKVIMTLGYQLFFR